MTDAQAAENHGDELQPESTQSSHEYLSNDLDHFNMHKNSHKMKKDILF